ncbi:lipopolysaccharide core biosynthesis protein rfaS [Capnocytophaga sp. ARDL2]|uniref:lipopolysaccharide core biosynthesis protein rfaS n=1 Tax=Capnocytophaga sp. ARDL2 TaxID=3238809 RepID=UPI003557684C
MIKKKKLLFYAPFDYEIDKVIQYYLEQLPEYEITALPQRHFYKNIFEKIANFFGKLFLQKKLKNEWVYQKQLKIFNDNLPFDECLIIRPDLIDNRLLKKIQHEIPKRTTLYWDSFEKIKGFKDTIPYFNQHFSFEKNDCKQYELQYISNFYIAKESKKVPEYDAFFFGAFDKRLPIVEKIIQHLSEKKWKVKALLIGGKKSSSTHQNIEREYIGYPFFESYKFSENTKIVLEINHENQKGLSMRVYEAIGLKRKIITTNPDIANYEFYNPNNILIINDVNNISILESFLDTPYEDLPIEMYEKYYIKNWLKTLLNI